MNNRLPDPRLTKIYRLEATVGEPQDSARSPRSPPHRSIDRRDLQRT